MLRKTYLVLSRESSIFSYTQTEKVVLYWTRIEASALTGFHGHRSSVSVSYMPPAFELYWFFLSQIVVVSLLLVNTSAMKN